jgi:hypothetical protein
VLVQGVDHFSSAPLSEILVELQLDDSLRHAADGEQHDGYAKEYQKRIEDLSGAAERVDFRVSYRADGDQRHVERVERRVMIDEDEAERSAGQDYDDRGRDQDEPVAEASHAVAILTAGFHIEAQQRAEVHETVKRSA